MPCAFPNSVCTSANTTKPGVSFSFCASDVAETRASLTFIGIRARPLSGRVVPFPPVVGVFLHHHQTSGHGHLPVGRPVQSVSAAAPPQHGERRVALERAERLRGVRDVEAQARAGAQIEEAVSGDPLPQHAARGPLAVLQHQVGAVHRDAALQRLALQDEHTLRWGARRQKEYIGMLCGAKISHRTSAWKVK